MVPVGGLEPPRPKATDFELMTSTFYIIFQCIKNKSRHFANSLQAIILELAQYGHTNSSSRH